MQAWMVSKKGKLGQATAAIGAKPVKAYKGMLLLKLGPTEQNKTEKNEYVPTYVKTIAC